MSSRRDDYPQSREPTEPCGPQCPEVEEEKHSEEPEKEQLMSLEQNQERVASGQEESISSVKQC